MQSLSKSTWTSAATWLTNFKSQLCQHSFCLKTNRLWSDKWDWQAKPESPHFFLNSRLIGSHLLQQNQSPNFLTPFGLSAMKQDLFKLVYPAAAFALGLFFATQAYGQSGSRNVSPTITGGFASSSCPTCSAGLGPVFQSQPQAFASPPIASSPVYAQPSFAGPISQPMPIQQPAFSVPNFRSASPYPLTNSYPTYSAPRAYPAYAAYPMNRVYRPSVYAPRTIARPVYSGANFYRPIRPSFGGCSGY